MVIIQDLRSTISGPKIIQIFSKSSRSKAYFIGYSSSFLVLEICVFLISGFYLTTNNQVFDHLNFPNIMSPEFTVKTSGYDYFMTV